MRKTVKHALGRVPLDERNALASLLAEVKLARRLLNAYNGGTNASEIRADMR
jgi:hypothetical protein